MFTLLTFVNIQPKYLCSHCKNIDLGYHKIARNHLSYVQDFIAMQISKLNYGKGILHDYEMQVLQMFTIIYARLTWVCDFQYLAIRNFALLKHSVQCKNRL